MKTKTIVSILFILFLLVSQAEAQKKDVGKSEKQTFNIHKTTEEEVVEDNSNTKRDAEIETEDKFAPEVKIIFPKITGSVFKTEAEQLIITGSVTDDSEIYQVIVADKQAEVAEGCIFQATIDLDYGINKVVIKATDVKYNISETELIIDRIAEKTASQGVSANEIVWVDITDNQILTEASCEIKARILTSENISSINLLVNENNININIPTQTNDIEYFIQQNIQLNAGTNNLQLKIVTDKITFEKNIVLNLKETLPNEIVWQRPFEDYIITSDKEVEIKACINTSEQLTKINIYNNEKLVEHGYIGSSKYCKYVVNEHIELTEGVNNIKIEVVTENNTFENSLIVEHELITSKYYAIIIGVSDYDDPDINDLAEPINDAQKLYDILTTDYTFEAENVSFLKNPTKGDIIGTLHNLRRTVKEDDNLLIFYAGHGYWDEEMGVGYWLPSDAEKDNPVNWLPNTDLTNYIGVIPAKHTLLIADACFSGSIFQSSRAFDNTKEVEQIYELDSRKAITSGTLKEVPDQSVFLKHFLLNLENNKQKYLTAQKLFTNMKEDIMNNSDNVPQYGTIQKTGDRGGDFIFKRREKK